MHQMEEWLLFASSTTAVFYVSAFFNSIFVKNKKLFLCKKICIKFGDYKDTQKKIKGTCNPSMHR